jgi:hypothetical protein
VRGSDCEGFDIPDPIDYRDNCIARAFDGLDSCGDGACMRWDEEVRDILFHKLSHARRFSLITQCFRNPSLYAASQMADSKISLATGIHRTPAVVGVVSEL